MRSARDFRASLVAIAVLVLVHSAGALESDDRHQDLKAQVRRLVFESCQGIPGCYEEKVEAFRGLPAEAADIMIEIWEKERRGDRINAIYYMGFVRGERPYEYLTMLIRKRAPGSDYAFSSLARRENDPRVFDFLAAYLHDPEPGIRYYAAGAFGEMDDPRAIPLLEALKEDPDPEVRRLAPKLVERVKRNVKEKKSSD